VTPGPKRDLDVLACNKPRSAPRLRSASAGRTCTCDSYDPHAGPLGVHCRVPCYLAFIVIVFDPC
jgi:hypothetical protein